MYSLVTSIKRVCAFLKFIATVINDNLNLPRSSILRKFVRIESDLLFFSSLSWLLEDAPEIELEQERKHTLIHTVLE